MPSTLHRTSTPQLIKASGTAADPYILENMDIDVRKLSNAGLTLLNAQHILVRNVRIRHAVAVVVVVPLAAVLLAAGFVLALIKKGRRAATSEQEGLALQSPTPAARARPPGKARKTASKKGARRLVDDEAAADDADAVPSAAAVAESAAPGWSRETVELE